MFEKEKSELLYDHLLFSNIAVCLRNAPFWRVGFSSWHSSLQVNVAFELSSELFSLYLSP